MAEASIPPGFDFTDPDLYARRVPAAELAELRALGTGLVESPAQGSLGIRR
jgi:cholest-4-en-3-one 26-monooxygenase